MESTKGVLVCLFSGFLAFLSPITGNIFSLVAIFFVNFFFGLLKSTLVDNERFRFRKAIVAVSESAVFFTIVLLVLFIGKFMSGAFTSALQFISFMTYSAFYFYGVNILRNVSKIYPKSRTIKFLHKVVSVEFVKYIPFLKKFIIEDKKKLNTNNN